MKHMRERTNEKGQALLIISIAMVVFLALVAVVLDAGNDYVQRRQLQNSLDAGSEAGALKLAFSNSTNGDVSDAVRTYVQNNGTDPNRVKAYYVVQDNSGNYTVVRSGTIDTYRRNNPTPRTLTVNGSRYPVVGVQPAGDRIFHPYYVSALAPFIAMLVGACAGESLRVL